MESVILALGSNLESPITQVKRAFEAIAQIDGCNLIAQSSLYSSSPRGPQDQSDYVNAVVVIETEHHPVELLQRTQHIEQAFGRVKTRHWGERIIDIDIAFYGQHQILLEEPALQIPHKEALLRDFVLIPCLEVRPDWVLPNGTALSEYRSSVISHTLCKIDENLACPSSNI